jgi:hypothetical protein
MARRASVSEDDLPELSTIFRAQAMKTTKDRAGKAVKTTAESAVRGMGDIEEGEVPQKAKPRRRVLKIVSDNPLLRPLGKEVGRGTERKQKAASSALVAVSTSVGVVESVDPEEAKETMNRFDKSVDKLMKPRESRESLREDEAKDLREEPRKEKKVADILQQQLQSEDEDVTRPRIRRTRMVKSGAIVRAETPE